MSVKTAVSLALVTGIRVARSSSLPNICVGDQKLQHCYNYHSQVWKNHTIGQPCLLQEDLLHNPTHVLLELSFSGTEPLLNCA